jgi:protein tyrosine phosphatase (PTP) superfamily phosphohydrolase (DUF442 family)
MGPIYNFSQVNAQLACSGQPAEEQLQDIANERYKVIINLAPTGTKYSLPDEAGSAAKLGLVYHHIPVQFDSPQLEELEDFLGLMKQHHDEKILVHCAANYRASCFTGLYLLSAGQFDRDAMDDFIANIWQPDAVWQQFIEDAVDDLNI